MCRAAVAGFSFIVLPADRIFVRLDVAGFVGRAPGTVSFALQRAVGWEAGYQRRVRAILGLLPGKEL